MEHAIKRQLSLIEPGRRQRRSDRPNGLQERRRTTRPLARMANDRASSGFSGQWLLEPNARTIRSILIDEDYAGGLQGALEASHGLRGPSNFGAGCLKALNGDDAQPGSLSEFFLT